MEISNVADLVVPSTAHVYDPENATVGWFNIRVQTQVKSSSPFWVVNFPVKSWDSCVHETVALSTKGFLMTMQVIVTLSLVRRDTLSDETLTSVGLTVII